MKLLLETIRQLASNAKACDAQFVPFCQAIDSGNELLAWQIILGNKAWLENQKIPLPRELEKLANGIGIKFHKNGQLWEKSNWENGKLHGLMEEFHENGQLWNRSNWQNGQLIG